MKAYSISDAERSRRANRLIALNRDPEFLKKKKAGKDKAMAEGRFCGLGAAGKIAAAAARVAKARTNLRRAETALAEAYAEMVRGMDADARAVIAGALNGGDH